ncbi:MAG TPA: hypothetical protein VE684_20690 [Crenalkalicoccus sp.]|jgi:hypothetical protein|nr:hypothetical protein [Crenalkalicoccus sp.]
MTPPRRVLLTGLTGLLALAAGCTPPPPGYPASLPPDAVQGAGDPTRAAIVTAAGVFGDPASVAGNPVSAARAVAMYEYLAVEIPTGPRWREFSPLVGPELVEGRAELRAALGIAPDAPPQEVIDRLFAASRALQAGDVAAAERILSPPVFVPGGRPLIERLAALPFLPKVSFAANRTQQEMIRVDQQGRFRGGGGMRF